MTYESSGEYLAKKQAPLPGYESPGEYLTDTAGRTATGRSRRSDLGQIFVR